MAITLSSKILPKPCGESHRLPWLFKGTRRGDSLTIVNFPRNQDFSPPRFLHFRSMCDDLPLARTKAAPPHSGCSHQNSNQSEHYERGNHQNGKEDDRPVLKSLPAFAFHEINCTISTQIEQDCNGCKIHNFHNLPSDFKFSVET